MTIILYPHTILSYYHTIYSRSQKNKNKICLEKFQPPMRGIRPGTLFPSG